MSEHDHRLMFLAAAVCFLATQIAVALLRQATTSIGPSRYGQVALAACSAGTGAWASHFIAILAYSPPVPVAYSLTFTLVSLAVSIAGAGVAFSFALFGAMRATAWIGGVIFGLGVSAMHYIGLLGLSMGGTVVWDIGLVITSIGLVVVLSAVALTLALERHVGLRIAGAALLTAGIGCLHITGMGAVGVTPDAAALSLTNTISSPWLAFLVASVAVTALMFSCAGLTLDIQERRHAERETERMKGLADAAVEGLLVCQGATIVTANASFADLSGCMVADMTGRLVADFMTDEDLVSKLLLRPDQPMETVLRHKGSGDIPVEVILRTIDFAGQPHHALAIRDLRDRKKAEQRISFLAHFDALTGLSNRATFNESLDAAILRASETGSVFCVLCLDLDRFKEVNDLYGHAAGDEMLQRVAGRVKAILPAGSIMARLGGDEFAILLPDAHDQADAMEAADAINQALRHDDNRSEGAPMVTSSIGIALYPADGADRHMLLNHGDTALYFAKEAGRGTYKFFESAMGAEVRDRRLLEHDLRLSLPHHELRMVYQPQTLIESGAIVGFEALLRWRHPLRGDVSPAVFIPIAEETGSILQIGEWVMRTVCTEAASWTAPLRVAVNVSAVQLHTPSYAESVMAILAETGLSPSRLEIEITETAIIRDMNRALGTLRRLKAMGIRIAMDDFGTGYSSLSNLRAFPFDKIKIDGSFVREVHRSEDSAAIVRAVLGLGRGLNLPILAEGVETKEEMNFLNAELCHEAQGYLMGRPAPIESFEATVHPQRAHAMADPIAAVQAA